MSSISTTTLTRTEIQDNVVRVIQADSSGLLNLAPRVGKSRIVLEVIKRDKPLTILWVTPSIKLRDIDIPLEFNKWGAKSFLFTTKIICWSSLHQCVGEYDLIILDEFQYITENNSVNLINKTLQSKRVLGLSGTPPKNAIKRELLSKLKLPILLDIGVKKAIKQKLIADYQINVVFTYLDHVKNVVAGNKQKTFLVSEAQQYGFLSRNPSKTYLQRMRFIYNSQTKEVIGKKLIDSLEGRKLIFSGSIEQAERLCENTYHSKTNDIALNKFIALEIDSLACVKAGGVGFTFKNLDHLIIIQTDSDTNGETSQKLFRSLLYKKGHTANIWFICLKDTVDEDWLKSALSSFEVDKIKYLKAHEIV